jgi:hypothetical protein
VKKLKLIIIALVIGSYSCQGQHNILSESEFNAVKFGDVSLIDIFQSLGDVDQMNTLFENDLTHAVNNTGFVPGLDFWLEDKLYINFENENGNQYDLSYIDVLNSSISVTVKGIEVRLGDHINIFGNNIEIIEHPDGKIVDFTDEGTGTSSLAFHINPTTNRVSEITFNAY